VKQAPRKPDMQDLLDTLDKIILITFKRVVAPQQGWFQALENFFHFFHQAYQAYLAHQVFLLWCDKLKIFFVQSPLSHPRFFSCPQLEEFLQYSRHTKHIYIEAFTNFLQRDLAKIPQTAVKGLT